MKLESGQRVVLSDNALVRSFGTSLKHLLLSQKRLCIMDWFSFVPVQGFPGQPRATDEVTLNPFDTES